MANYYAEAIRALREKNINFEKVVYELAATHPKIFMELLAPKRNVFEVLKKEPWQNTVRDFLGQGMKVDAIKLARQETGLGLKEAKDVCDFAAHFMDPMRASPPIAAISDEHIKLAKKIAE